MGFFKKKVDPISERSKALNARIAALEAEIKKLDGKLQPGPTPKAIVSSSPGRAPAGSLAREPIFESVDPSRLDPDAEAEETEGHYNDLGVRKYDLAAAWRRFRNQFRTPPARNPKLVTFLAAGSIKGLRPLRYEKRVARNRFVTLLIVLLLLLWGIFYSFIRR